MTPRHRRLAMPATVLALLFAACQGLGPRHEGGDPDHASSQRIHFLIPGAPGGGWDGTARGVGRALVESGLLAEASFENLSGGGGGRALAHLIATAPRQERTWMVSSTPILLRSLRRRLPQSYRDLTPIAAVIGDYLTFVVRADSELASWPQLVAAYRRDPRRVKVAGGSVLGGMDHVVSALAVRAAGLDATRLRYVPYDTGGKAMTALLSGETPVLATGLGEAMEAWRSGHVRILAITAAGRVEEAPQIPTLRELGCDVEFVNWRGFFGPPGLMPEAVDAYVELLRKLQRTPAWETTRRRNGWVPLFKPGPDFSRFLKQQEAALAELLGELGVTALGRAGRDGGLMGARAVFETPGAARTPP